MPMPGQNIAQLRLVGSDLYFVSQDAANTNGLFGKLPAGGGAPQVLVDFSQVTGYLGNFVNALAIAGGKAYVGTFDSSASTTLQPQIWIVDLANPSNVTKLADLPKGKTGAGTTNLGLVNLHFDPNQPNVLIGLGFGGDILRYDVNTMALIDHRWSGTALASPGTNSVNSFAIDPQSDDYLIGTRDGFIDLFVHSHNGEKWVTGVGSDATPTNNSVSGVWYMPRGSGEYKAFGPGCPGAGGFTPTSFGLGVPVAGSSTFGFGMASGTGGTVAIFLLGSSNTDFSGVPLPFDLTGVGLPGCSLRVNILLALTSVLGGTGDGVGVGVIPFAVPPGTSGVVGYTQWLTFNASLQLNAVSDGRRFKIL
jgi:hypothetical protein